MKREVLFVCLGNICRSPAAEGMLRQMHSQSHSPLELTIESAGTGGWHVGELPDKRMREAAKQRGITLESHAQQFNPAFFDRFHYILAADSWVMKELLTMAKETAHKDKVFLFSHFASKIAGQDVPDPYYGGEEDFHRVLDLLEDACQGFLDHLHEEARKRP